MHTETVVIVHGFGGHRWLMIPLARSLFRAGFLTVNWGYRSFFSNIQTHAARFREELEQLQSQTETARLHIVAHSMGALVTRQALLQAELDKLGRIVLLCPPNRGSHVASLYARPFGWFCETLTQISDLPHSFARSLPPTLAERYEVGIIAAGSDFVVRPESTHLPSAKQYTVVRGFHSSMLFSSRTAELATRFIRHGRF